MDLLPSIDVRSGRVVRLSQGEPTRQTVYGDDPVAIAEQFAQAGARWIHLVDLDRAFNEGDNSTTISRVVSQLAPQVRIQLGGGLRTIDLVRASLDWGVERVVIGTAAATNPELVSSAVKEFGSDRLAVGIDAREGYVAIRGWSQTSSQRAGDLARRVVQDGVTTVVYTDIARDGMLSGPDLSGAVDLKATGACVILSGGVSGLVDIHDACVAGIDGVVVGRALYEGRLNLIDALAAASCLSRA
ncbi:MAG TPA: 1-(5-phosphoribosyl)-5-[(5-phosphoribosylamino)methylideneamino]imidazole-4-carboxamide isomerase [Gemmatimonadales bacterium]|nr:1-(5-phosphoribosyl)-5-[(5-phosphoribosylamino)methylideneamino]imidazole-4-carboxamide isomerase [Gemmatimonadales bacterium]